MAGRLLNPREAEAVAIMVCEHCPDHPAVAQVRWIGNCPICQKATLHCCYNGSWVETSFCNDFLHFCTSCHQHSFSSQLDQEDVGLSGAVAVCPFCGYDWGRGCQK